MTNHARSCLYLSEHRHGVARAKGVPYGNPWGGQMGGTTVPLHTSDTHRTYMCCDTQYMCSPLHGIPNPPVAVHVYQQSSRASHPPQPNCCCFCCSVAKAHLSMPATEELTINQFFGFLLLGDRLHRSTIWLRCKYRGGDTQQIRDHTHATPNVEHDHR